MRELKPRAEFRLNARPPFDFYSTVESEIEVRRMEGYPPLVDHFDGNAYWTTFRMSNGDISGLRIEPHPTQRGTHTDGLHVTIFADKEVDDRDLRMTKESVVDCWGLNENITEFYNVSKQPPVIRKAIERHRGLRALTWQEPFQIVCIAILLQNATVARTNDMIAKLIHRYGTPIQFAGLTLRHWFSPERLAEVDLVELREKCRLGFRAERLSATAKTLAKGGVSLTQLKTLPTDTAKQILIQLEGIGEYSAELVLIGMRRWDVFPVDAWSTCQFHRILFPNEPLPPTPKAAAAVRKRAQELWGDWRGLVWNFVLHELDQLAEESETEESITLSPIMQDLEKAKKRLSEKNLTLSIVKNDRLLFETSLHGITGFLEAIDRFGQNLEGASAADKVAGKAIALLCAYAKVKAVYAVTLSKKAKVVFEENAIHHEWQKLVENILDKRKEKMCPFEKAAIEISDPNNAYERLKALQDSLKRCT